MFLELGNNVSMTDAQFQEEMMKRRAQNPGSDHFLGCPLCSVADRVRRSDTTQNQQRSNSRGYARVVENRGSSFAASLALSQRLCARRPHAQVLTYTKGQPISAAYEGWEVDPDGCEVLRVRLHEQELGRGDGHARSGPDNGVPTGTDRPRPTDAFLPAAKPLRVQGAGSQSVHARGTSWCGP